MAIDQNPYQAYTDGSIFSDDPLNLVVALYQGALDAAQQAEVAVQAKDISGRTKAINKAISILTELLVSVDVERGGEIGQNLRQLYIYMQKQLMNAHIRTGSRTHRGSFQTPRQLFWKDGEACNIPQEPPQPPLSTCLRFRIAPELPRIRQFTVVTTKRVWPPQPIRRTHSDLMGREKDGGVLALFVAAASRKADRI